MLVLAQDWWFLKGKGTIARACGAIWQERVMMPRFRLVLPAGFLPQGQR